MTSSIFVRAVDSHRVRHVGGHAYDCARPGGDSAPTDGQHKNTLDDEHERVERRAVLARP